MQKILLIIICMFILCSCGVDPKAQGSRNIEVIDKKVLSRANEIIKNDPDADILLLPGYLYQKSDNQNIDMTPGLFIGQISKQHTNNDEFSFYMASKLPKGTNLYYSKTPPMHVLAQTEHGYIIYKNMSLE